MASTMKLENKLEGVTNFRAWNTRIELNLTREDLLEMVQGKITEPTNEAGKKKYKKDDITAMSIIVDSIKDHLVPYIS